MLVLCGAGLFLFSQARKKDSERLQLFSPQISLSSQQNEWEKLSAVWRDEQKRAAAMSPTNWHWTRRDDDAYRILQDVARHLEGFRRAEARKERLTWWQEQLQSDRNEWKALVESVPATFPADK